MSFGTGPFGVSVFGIPAVALPSENRGQLTSSRMVTGSRADFLQTTDGTGAFQPMSDVMNRVYFLIAMEVKAPKKIGRYFEAETRQAITNALRPVTQSKPPVARIESITVEDSGTSLTFATIEVQDLTTGQTNIVKARR